MIAKINDLFKRKDGQFLYFIKIYNLPSIEIKIIFNLFFIVIKSKFKTVFSYFKLITTY